MRTVTNESHESFKPGQSMSESHVILENARDPIVDIDLDALIQPARLLRPIEDGVVCELARSIENSGLLQPIVVRENGPKYEIIFGQHRVEAFRRLGIPKIRAMVKHLDDGEAFLARVSENLVRNAYVNPMEEAKGYNELVNHGWTINAIARRIGKCDSYVSERLALLHRLDHSLLSKVSGASRYLTPSHAELLSRIKDPRKQRSLAEFVERKRLSVRGLEDILNGAPPPTKTRIQMFADHCGVNIPSEYLDAMGLSPGKYCMLYMRGNKLILENMMDRRRIKKSKQRQPF